MPSLTVTALRGLPEVVEGDDLALLIANALQDNGIEASDPILVVISSKAVSKMRGLWSRAGREATIDAETVRVVAERWAADRTTAIVEAKAGPVMAAAGVDASNTGGRLDLLVLPHDADEEAISLRRNLICLLDMAGNSTHGESLTDNSETGGSAVVRGLTGAKPNGISTPRHRALGVVISDTAGRPWRAGQVDFALGSSGVLPMLDHRGERDHDGRELSVTSRCLVDELAAMADLAKGKADGIPAAVVQGCPPGWFHDDAPGARTVVRTGASDWFALGHVEAARAALGVPPASPAAKRLGMRSLSAETTQERARRALAVALHGEAPAEAFVLDPTTDGAPTGDGTRIVITTEDPYLAGRLVARLQVALWSEDLALTEDVTPRRPPADPLVLSVRDLPNDQPR